MLRMMCAAPGICISPPPENVRSCSPISAMSHVANILQGMFNEARGRMDEAQQWYEGIMEKATLDQGALKRQIAQVPP